LGSFSLSFQVLSRSHQIGSGLCFSPLWRFVPPPLWVGGQISSDDNQRISVSIPSHHTPLALTHSSSTLLTSPHPFPSPNHFLTHPISLTLRLTPHYIPSPPTSYPFHSTLQSISTPHHLQRHPVLSPNPFPSGLTSPFPLPLPVSLSSLRPRPRNPLPFARAVPHSFLDFP
jgi:hypothetical protein